MEPLPSCRPASVPRSSCVATSSRPRRRQPRRRGPDRHGEEPDVPRTLPTAAVPARLVGTVPPGGVDVARDRREQARRLAHQAFDESRLAAQLDAGVRGRIIFGSGNRVGTRISALAEQGVAPPRPVLDFGDVDPGGIRAAQLAVSTASALDWPAVRPSRRLYELALASPHAWPDHQHPPTRWPGPPAGLAATWAHRFAGASRPAKLSARRRSAWRYSSGTCLR